MADKKAKKEDDAPKFVEPDTYIKAGNFGQRKFKHGRKLGGLFAFKGTVQCAFGGCIPCNYKLVRRGAPLAPGIAVLTARNHPLLQLVAPTAGCAQNQRPEMCPRARASEKAPDAATPRCGMYAQGQAVLTVGDGDFTFSLSLAKSLGGKTLTATSYLSLAQLEEAYPAITETLAELRELGATVLHEVDATALAKTPALGGQTFDRVIWNFPCVSMDGGKDAQDKEIPINQQLCRDFFTNAPAFLNARGQVHVTHKTKAPFSFWEMETLDQGTPLKIHGSVVFDKCEYPGYKNKKVVNNGTFPLWDSQQYLLHLEAAGADVEVALPPLEGEEAAAEAAVGPAAKAAGAFSALRAGDSSDDDADVNSGDEGGGGMGAMEGGLMSEWGEGRWAAAPALIRVTETMLDECIAILKRPPKPREDARGGAKKGKKRKKDVYEQKADHDASAKKGKFKKNQFDGVQTHASTRAKAVQKFGGYAKAGKGKGKKAIGGKDGGKSGR
jgi:25S rRNA (uracil2634-N3)-methyltransferase